MVKDSKGLEIYYSMNKKKRSIMLWSRPNMTRFTIWV
jgi:hypothetical protein